MFTICICKIINVDVGSTLMFAGLQFVLNCPVRVKIVDLIVLVPDQRLFYINMKLFFFQSSQNSLYRYCPLYLLLIFLNVQINMDEYSLKEVSMVFTSLLSGLNS